MDNLSAEAAELWRRLGLEELYGQIRKTEEVIRLFSQELRKLPKCKTCARSALLRGLQESGNSLSVQLISLGILSSALREAVSAAEKACEDVGQGESAPCRCAGEPCSCHD